MAAVIAYLRPAGDADDARAAAVEEQRGAVQAWARKGGHRIVAVAADDAAANLEERRGLAEAIAALRVGAVDGIVVRSLDSLAEDLVVQEQLLAELRRLGAKVYSLNRAEAVELRSTPADPSRRVIRRVLAVAAETAPSITALRAAASGAMRGPGPVVGSPPYGYQAENGSLVPDPTEQSALARIADLRASGATLREIARSLQLEGHRPKRAEKWHPETVRRIAERLDR